MLPLCIHLLGQVRVERGDGTPVAGRLWRRTKVRALLALLLLNHNRPLHRDFILDTLWPHLERESASANLDTTVYDLRKSLEPELIGGSNSAYLQRYESSYFLVDADRHWVDSWAFQAAFERARQEEEAHEAIALYCEALGLYCDHLLAELGDNASWCQHERNRLSDLALIAREEIASHYVHLGEHGSAAVAYETILTLDPCRETACQHLMQLHLRRGERVKAVVEYQRLTRALKQHFGLQPGQETRRLYEQASRS